MFTKIGRFDAQSQKDCCTSCGCEPHKNDMVMVDGFVFCAPHAQNIAGNCEDCGQDFHTCTCPPVFNNP